MLDKTRSTKAAKKQPLRTYDELVKAHARMARRIDFHTAIESEIGMFAGRICEYALTHYMEIFGTKKSHILPEGAIGLKVIPGRISSGDLDRKAYHAALRAEGLGDCIKDEPVVNEAALKARLESNPKLLERLQRRIPGLKVGKSYDQFWIEFAGRDKRVTGDAAERAFDVTVPDKRRKKKAATAA